jgi:trehalose synthase
MTLHPHEVRAPPLSPDRFKELLDPDAWAEFAEGLQFARDLLNGRVVWNVNSTAQGGGVAEMLRPFVSYARGAGVDMRWVALQGTPEFFAVTKRLHNFLHGERGDGGELGAREHEIYEQVTHMNAEELAATVRPEDVVILHDPQTAGLASALERQGPVVVWRSHIGAEEPNERVHLAWAFIRPYLEEVDACVFSRHAYVPRWDLRERTVVIQPSIDAFSPKNQEMDPAVVEAILVHVGLLVDGASPGVTPTYVRFDGSPGRVDHRAEVLSTGPPPPSDAALVTQVSRWDRLKDHAGAMLGFAEHTLDGTDAHLVLAGPSVTGVADDPEGAQVLAEVTEAWHGLPHSQRARVHLASLPMVDVDENAAIVNALQRHSTVITQKSLQEGFGLTVAEAMWKSRPVVASAVGGIKDQIIDGESGVLLDDPRDLVRFGEVVRELLGDEERRRSIGSNAHERVRRQFLVNRHALQYIELLGGLLGGRG